MFELMSKIVSVGSVDGVLTTAALLAARNPHTLLEEPGIEFCQAFTVDRLHPETWQKGQVVALVDLAVNNRDPQMTQDFVDRIYANGHELVAIIDEHNAEDWETILGKDRFDLLEIKPVSQEHGEIKSSGALFMREYLKRVPGNKINSQIIQLCQSADEADKMNFESHFARYVNQAVKSNIRDDSRRVYLARHFARHFTPDEKIWEWIDEYSDILQNHRIVLKEAKEITKKILSINIINRKVDMTTLMKEVYSLGYDIVVVKGKFYNKKEGKLTEQVAFGCRPGYDLDLLGLFKSKGIDASGFKSKANVSPADAERAIKLLERS